ncbi:MAG TPA: protein kinase, partial [Polyangiaceae bacterium]|nr:protein kinase [Polyangiaceae bacterium]
MAEDRASHLVGQVVAGRYLVDAVLGQGGQGVVYRAQDQRTGLPVALKVLNEPASRDSQIAGRFLREQAALQALAGTSAVRVYAAGETSDRNLFLALELLEGHDLEQELDQLQAGGRPPAFS